MSISTGLDDDRRIARVQYLVDAYRSEFSRLTDEHLENLMAVLSSSGQLAAEEFESEGGAKERAASKASRNSKVSHALELPEVEVHELEFEFDEPEGDVAQAERAEAQAKIVEAERGFDSEGTHSETRTDWPNHTAVKRRSKRMSGVRNSIVMTPLDAIEAEAEQIEEWTAEREAYMKRVLRIELQTSKLDTLIGVVILMNALVMVLQLQWAGTRSAVALGIFEEHSWQDAGFVLDVLEQICTVIYLLELCCRLYQDRWVYFRSYFNIADALLVITTVIEGWILTPLLTSNASSSGNVSLLRVMRMAKVIRATRIIRAIRLFQGLRQLVKACTSALTTLFWSVILLTVCITTASLVIGNLLQDYLLDPANNYDEQVWVWEHYGTAANTLYTIFEITFAGNWPVYARPVLKSCGRWYVIFFLGYIVLVVFAVIRVIGAIFLKDAMDAATSDPELMVHFKERQKNKYTHKIQEFFSAIDASKDGLLTRQELDSMLSSSKVTAYFAALDIELHEGSKLFDMLDDGDGVVTFKEFVHGLLRFRGMARSVDLMELHMRLQTMEDALLAEINQVSRASLRASRAEELEAKRRARGKRFTEMIHTEVAQFASDD